MIIQTKRLILYLYILGAKNKSDRISTPVPFRINEQEIFYGPCKKAIREEIRKLFPSRDTIYPESENYEIYIVGINPAKNTRQQKVPRSVLFAGKIEKIFTFESAWKYYKNRSLNNENIAEMIEGIENFSPLHLEPQYDKNNGEFIGYKHLTKEHKNNWLTDLLSQNELNRLTKEEENTIYDNSLILSNDQIKFERDCCFELHNIHFSDKKNPNPIPLDNKLLNLIKSGLKNPKNADLESPLGYNKNGQKYGRGHVKLIDEGASKFITILKEKIN